MEYYQLAKRIKRSHGEFELEMSSSSSYWCDIPTDILPLIIQKPNLSVSDIVTMSSVCSSWRTQIGKLVSFKGLPFLLLPSAEYDQSNDKSLRLFSVSDDMRISYAVGKLLRGGVSIGSSHEWLFLLDVHSYLWLINIFSGQKIQLPKLPFKALVVIDHKDIIDEGLLHWRIPIEKAVLSGSPSYCKSYKAVIIYGHYMRLAVCHVNSGVMSDWKILCRQDKYVDVVWNRNMLYTLTQSRHVVAWDFEESNNENPKRKMMFSHSCYEKINDIDDDVFQFDEIKMYLAISEEGLKLIHRYIGDRVNGDGKVVEEEDLLPDDDTNHPLVCPYRTLKFRVFKVDLERGMWVKVDSLKDEVVFLGGNQTFCLSSKDYTGLKKNSIYFTDNYWDRINEDYLYGGHDIGVYNLESDKVDMFVDSDRIVPIPFWVCMF